MSRTIRLALLTSVLLGLHLTAQPANELEQARQVLATAKMVGAADLAPSLYEDAVYRLRFADENWNASKPEVREKARMRAREALFAAEAAFAKAQWLSTNVTIVTLQGDIRRFGGTSNVATVDEIPGIDYHRGTTTMNRITAAQLAVDEARQAGAGSLPNNNLASAQGNIDSAWKVSLRGKKDSDIADHLAYVAEMMARRAFYEARLHDALHYVPDLQNQRTNLAREASERQAAAERQQRIEEQRRNAELQQRLLQEQQNRAAQQAELDRLRAQIADAHAAQLLQVENDRQARVAAELRLDALVQQYETSIAANGTASDLEVLRRQVEDQQIALRAIQSRELLSETAMSGDVDRLRTQLEAARAAGVMSPEALNARYAELQARQVELERLRAERQASLAHRADVEQRQTVAITDAQRRRQEAEIQAAQLRQQAAEAQQQALAAQQQAAAAQQQAQQSQEQAQQATRQAEQSDRQAHEAAQQAEQAAQKAQQAVQETQLAQQQAAQAQAELEATKTRLAASDAEARQLRLEQSLARFASTHRDPDRGIIVTLPSIMFDPGKARLKPGAKSTLKKIADQLENEPTLVITIEGHTDSTGGSAKNLKLSSERAEAVRNALVGAGINRDHLTAIGKGEADPVASNKTAAGRQQNRRVEIIIAR